jgi:hypothetical protein
MRYRVGQPICSPVQRFRTVLCRTVQCTQELRASNFANQSWQRSPGRLALLYAARSGTSPAAVEVFADILSRHAALQHFPLPRSFPRHVPFRWYLWTAGQGYSRGRLLQLNKERLRCRRRLANDAELANSTRKPDPAQARKCMHVTFTLRLLLHPTTSPARESQRFC